MAEDADDIEQRLAAAAQAAREFEVTGQRCSDLRAREDELGNELAALRVRCAAEDTEVARLEHLSLTKVLAALTGSREEALTRERAEAAAARYQVVGAEARLEALRHELAAAQQRHDQLSAAPQGYAAALADKERHLAESDDPRRPQLLNLADERGRLTGELAELTQALHAAEAAQQALSELSDKVGSASGWSTYDTFFGGGMIATSIEHRRLDEAADAAAEADQRVALLRTKLAEVHGTPPTSPLLAISARTKFVDMWFDNIFTDLSVHDRIRQARQNVDQSLQAVREVHDRLTARIAQAQARLTAIEAERRDLLTR